MKIAIDATNIRAGGGLTHLKEVLKVYNPNQLNFEVTIFATQKTLNQIEDKNWIIKKTNIYIETHFISRFFFSFFLLEKKLREQECSILFVPGALYLGNFKPFVTISQNMLPFDKIERNRFSLLKDKLRFRVLKIFQTNTFRHANGVIFLTEYAKRTIAKIIPLKDCTVIPHGVNPTYSTKPKVQKELSEYSYENPFELLYVSIITVYKHQWNVAQAVINLYKKGIPIKLVLVGPSIKEATIKLEEISTKNPIFNSCVEVVGAVPHSEIFNYYSKADGFIFASTCENQPIIMIEAMSNGLPIITSNKSPMPEVLESKFDLYFNAESVTDIEEKLLVFLQSKPIREQVSREAFEKSQKYTWKNTADATFNYIISKAN